MEPDSKTTSATEAPAIPLEGDTGPMMVPKTVSPRPTVKRRGPISCIADEYMRGRLVTRHWFAVPAENYGDGWLTGYSLAEEFMSALDAESLPYGAMGFDPLGVIVAAAQATEEEGEQSRRGAGVAFLRMMIEVASYGARLGVHTQVVQWHVSRSLEWREKARAERAVRGREFARRMEIAKASKAMARRVIEKTAAKR
jgi:hypothetical protein